MKRKIYEPVREFERQTSYCPLYLAWHVVDEARNYFRTELVPSSGSATLTRSRPLVRPPRAFASQIPFAASQAAQVSHRMGEGQLARKLARRAEAVFAKHPFWQRKYKSANGRGYILSSMRHWLAGVLAKENPVLFRQLPESFKIGMPLPEQPVGTLRCGVRTSQRDVPTNARSGSRGRSPHHRFVHGCELLVV